MLFCGGKIFSHPITEEQRTEKEGFFNISLKFKCIVS